MMKWNVGLKIGLGYILAMILLVIIGSVSYQTTNELAAGIAMVDKTQEEIIKLNGIITQLQAAESAERAYVITGEDSYLAIYSDASISIPKDLAQLRNIMSTNEILLVKLNALESVVNSKLQRITLIIQTRKNSGEDAAYALVKDGTGKVAMNLVSDAVTDIEKELDLLLVQRQTAEDQSKQIIFSIITLGIPMSIVLIIIVGIFIVRGITIPLKEATEMANRIAVGDLSVLPSDQKRHDEIGELSRAFYTMTDSLNEMAKTTQCISAGDYSVTLKPKSEKDIMGNALSLMVESLRNVATTANSIADGDLTINVIAKSEKDMMGNALCAMVESLRQMANVAGRISQGDLTVKIDPKSSKDVMGNTLSTMVISLREMTREILEGVNVISSASAEIMASTSQVASGAMETASAIIETTSSVEEVKQSAQMANEKSRTVSETTQEIVQVSENGIRSVEQSIIGMSRIQDQVESIAQSLIRLSEQSQAIGEIISSVNDLAEQSNLLAVNAAIEAAKAGDQGKGFAVVAQEVKVLAEQSKEATSQVRGILNDILKAINIAVIATEQGGKAVESGVIQSREAGETIRKMADGIGNAAHMAIQISVTSQQQLVGMDQIVLAMENIRQASEQNVSGTKQVESTVQNLHELGQRLKQTVGKYKI